MDLTSTSSIKQEISILVSSVKSGLWSYVSVCLRNTLTMKEQFQEVLTKNVVQAYVLLHNHDKITGIVKYYLL